VVLAWTSDVGTGTTDVLALATWFLCLKADTRVTRALEVDVPEIEIRVVHRDEEDFELLLAIVKSKFLHRL